MLTVYKSSEELATQAARSIASWMRESNGVFHLALSGGSTPERLFGVLAAAEYAGLPWQRAHLYWCDERCVSVEDEQSNFGQAQRLLLRHIPLRPENIHRIPAELPPEQAAQAYAATLASLAAPGLSWPRLDLALLGLGEDGHTASLFPGDSSPAAAQQSVIAVSAHYQGRPANRVSLTPLLFNTAHRVAFLVSGANKAQALAGSLRGAYDPARWPAQRIQPADGKIFWWADAEAAQELR